MSKIEKLVEKLLLGNSDKNFPLTDLVNVLLSLGFYEKQGKGSHTLYKKDGIDAFVNLQKSKGGKAKPYQVKQVRELILKYDL